MELDLEQIKAAALAVTAGPWAAYGTIVRDVDGGEDQLAQGCDFEHARYIAAVDPEVVLELVERLERSEAARAEVLEEAAVKAETALCDCCWSEGEVEAGNEIAFQIRAMKSDDCGVTPDAGSIPTREPD